ncbi:MAG: hypothetical protein AAB490_01735, partial [Patescibacteria group bacterium]
FLETLPANFERNGETLYSPRMVLKHRRAHCTEGALFAAAALRLHGHKPLVLDLKTTAKDEYHAIAVFKIRGRWGAISKTNHPVLRYRDPVYLSIRELVMSYFHEYFMRDGAKTLRSYTNPLDLSRFDAKGWMTDEKNLWYIDRFLTSMKHISILPKGVALRKADRIERRATETTEWKKDGRRRR